MKWEDLKFQEPKGDDPDEWKKYASMCRSTFTTASGLEFQEWMTRRILQPVCPYNKEVGYGYFREGENNILRLILNGTHYYDKVNK